MTIKEIRDQRVAILQLLLANYQQELAKQFPTAENLRINNCMMWVENELTATETGSYKAALEGEKMPGP